jgi:Tol biopolymer transport system component
VEIRGAEIWLVGDGQPRQITHDGKFKVTPVLSPSQKRIAYVEQCSGQCAPSVVVLDLDGRHVISFQPRHEIVPPIEPCSSILSVVWVGDGAVAAVCHINPSLTEFIETDVSTGRNTRDLSGLGFTPSPDGKSVAHVGWIIHFAPPFAQSYYLQVDHTTIYPLPAGTKPIEQIGLTEVPKVVRKEGPTYKGIHEFWDMYWSPDSKQIALIDCTYDWTPNTPESLSAADGKESGRRWALAVVSTTGKFVTFPLIETNGRDLGEARISWKNPRELSLDVKGNVRTFRIP